MLREKIHRMEPDALWYGGGRSHEPRRFALHEEKSPAWCVSQMNGKCAFQFTITRIAATTRRVLQRRGPRPLERAVLLEKDPRGLADYPLYGEGHRKGWGGCALRKTNARSG